MAYRELRDEMAAEALTDQISDGIEIRRIPDGGDQHDVDFELGADSYVSLVLFGERRYVDGNARYVHHFA